jgi:hypothetical protein
MAGMVAEFVGQLVAACEVMQGTVARPPARPSRNPSCQQGPGRVSRSSQVASSRLIRASMALPSAAAAT